MNVMQLRGNMGQRQVRHYTVVVIQLHMTILSDICSSPGQVIMGNHHCFGRPRGTGGVDHCSAVTRRDAVHTHIKTAIRHWHSQSKKFLPSIHRHATLLCQWCIHFSHIPHHNALQVKQRGGHFSILLKLDVSVNNHYLGATVLRNIVAAFHCVSVVYPRRDAACQNGPHVGHKPLRL